MTRTATSAHPLDVALELEPLGDGTLTGRTTEAYANMVGPFGGITASTMLTAALRHPERLGDPVSLTVNFAGPVADGPFTIDARPTRTNNSTQHWTIEMTQDGVVATTATAVFALRRETWSSTEVSPPVAPPAEAVAPTPGPEFIRWMGNYDLRFVDGGMTDIDGESDDSTTTLWIRDNPARALDFSSLTALCDSFYPRVFLRRGQMCPAGTVSLTIYFHVDADALAEQGDDAVLATARAQHFGRSYFDQSAELWGRDGTLLATSHQVMYFKV
ncbi:thioesterase family protein [Rhodococcus sp. Q]|uniref:acyl-CoA thioesterase n=1 Tax=Rhodococcus sp. Q TaxID=2502252 RepID=UPI0010F7D2A9|nr:thioesterase family protein [Rhodococcus sp. Q]